MAAANLVAFPEWTETTQRTGLDPLGMQNTSVAMYQKLLPGISNVTLRMRYYGLYAWLCREYAERFRDTNPETWQRFVCRAEALYALIAQRTGEERGVAGTIWATRKLATGDRQLAFGADADPGKSRRYLKQPWGAYGAAYASQLFEIGIFAPAREHSIPVPSEEIGDALALAFAEALGDLADRFIATLERGDVTLDGLDAFAPMAPSAIEPDGGEHSYYRDVLFARTGLARASDLSRRDSLLLVLNVAQGLGYSPTVADIRWGLYAGRLPDGTPLALPDGLEGHREHWWSYQINDLSHICFETLLKFTLSTLGQHDTGVRPGDLITEVLNSILAVPTEAPETWADLLAETDLADNAWSDAIDNSESRLCDVVMHVAGARGVCSAEQAWDAVRLLAVLNKRVDSAAWRIDADLAEFDPLAFRSALTEIRFLGENLHAPFRTILQRLIEERVIGRHLSIAMRKLRFQGDYTFLIENDDGRLRFRNMDGPVFTNPRLGPVLSFLNDLQLLDEDGITTRGVDLLTSASA